MLIGDTYQNRLGLRLQEMRHGNQIRMPCLHLESKPISIAASHRKRTERTYSFAFIKRLLLPPNRITALLTPLLQFVILLSLNLQFILLSLLDIRAPLLRRGVRALRECTQQRTE